MALRDRVHVGAEAEITPDTKIAVYESYLDEEYTNTRAKRLMIKN